MTKAEEPKVHDLRDDRPDPPANPKVVKQQPDNGLHELIQVDQPHLATPGIGGTPAGQTTHE